MGGDAGSGDASTVGTWVSISMGKDAQKGHEKQCRHVRVEAQSVSRCESRPRERARGWPSGVEVEGGGGANGLVLWSEGTLEAVRVLFRKQCLSLCVIESFLVTETERDQTAHTSQSTRHTEHARRQSSSAPSFKVLPSAQRYTPLPLQLHERVSFGHALLGAFLDVHVRVQRRHCRKPHSHGRTVHNIVLEELGP
jgi:hypothetical protein